MKICYWLFTGWQARTIGRTWANRAAGPQMTFKSRSSGPSSHPCRRRRADKPASTWHGIPNAMTWPSMVSCSRSRIRLVLICIGRSLWSKTKMTNRITGSTSWYRIRGSRKCRSTPNTTRTTRGRTQEVKTSTRRTASQIKRSTPWFVDHRSRSAGRYRTIRNSNCSKCRLLGRNPQQPNHHQAINQWAARCWVRRIATTHTKSIRPPASSSMRILIRIRRAMRSRNFLMVRLKVIIRIRLMWIRSRHRGIMRRSARKWNRRITISQSSRIGRGRWEKMWITIKILMIKWKRINVTTNSTFNCHRMAAKIPSDTSLNTWSDQISRRPSRHCESNMRRKSWNSITICGSCSRIIWIRR